MNGILAEHGVNIEGQMLDTSAESGYVVTDVVSQLPEALLDQLRSMPETIRLRVVN